MLLIIGIVLTFNDYSYRGYYTDKIINWTWLLLSFLIVIIYWNKEYIKISLITFIIFIMLSIIPMGIPFFGMVYYFSSIDDYQQIQLNENYRIERTRQNALSMPRIYIYKENGILEKNICRPSYSEILGKVLNVEEYKNSIDERKTDIQNARLVLINNDSIGIEYQILNKKKIIYEKLNENDGY